jgi:hypothetical protein
MVVVSESDGYGASFTLAPDATTRLPVVWRMKTSQGPPLKVRSVATSMPAYDSGVTVV